MLDADNSFIGKQLRKLVKRKGNACESGNVINDQRKLCGICQIKKVLLYLGKSEFVVKWGDR